MNEPSPSGGSDSGGPAPSPKEPRALPRFDRRRPLGWRFLLVWALAITVATIFASIGYRETRYVQTSAAFCSAACHHPNEPTGKTHEGHKDVACQTCHETTLSTGIKLRIQSAITRPDHPLKHGAVPAAACATCHERKPASWNLIAQTEGHRSHQGAKDVSCLSCHSSAQSARPPETICRDCHEDQRLHKAETKDAETCLSCHSFAVSPERASEPTTLACERCHAPAGTISKSTADGARPMKAVNEHVLHGGVSCQLCHNAHGKKARAPEGQPVCVRCHQIELFTAGREVRKAPEGHSNCEQCHTPHAPLQTALESCGACHKKNATAASEATTSTALKHKNCSSCHLPHSWRAEPSGCLTCHKEQAVMIETRSPPKHGSCANCHEPHGPPPTGAVCVSCHSKTKGSHVALAPDRHKDCTSCHNPHAPSPKEASASCAKCHLTELAQNVRSGIEAHAQGNGCMTCHKPHDDPKPPPALCGQCHADKAVFVSMAGPSKHQVCTSCHQPHSFAIKDIVTACSNCHGASGAKSGAASAVVLDFAGGAHKGECKSCHVVHGPPSIAQSDCIKCHAPIEAKFKASNEKHADCGSCHQPHQTAKSAPARCGTCHAPAVTSAAAWPANSAHTQACTGCHQPHDARSKKACADCHAKEATSASGGKHQCTQCHAPHKPPPGRGPAWWSTCSSCHAAKVESSKALGPKHSDCKNCHEPHRFSPPSCASCHASAAAKGLHMSKSHAASCNACHDAHVKAEPTKAQCLSCHSDRKRHQPDAEKCFGCHLFR